MRTRIIALFLIAHSTLFGQEIQYDNQQFEIVEIRNSSSLLHGLKSINSGFEERLVQFVSEDRLSIYQFETTDTSYQLQEIKNESTVQLNYSPFDHVQVMISDYFFVYTEEKGWLSNAYCSDSVQFSADGLTAVVIENRSENSRRVFTLEDVSSIQLVRDSKTKEIVVFSLVLVNNYKLLPPVWIRNSDLYNLFNWNSFEE